MTIPISNLSILVNLCFENLSNVLLTLPVTALIGLIVKNLYLNIDNARLYDKFLLFRLNRIQVM
jgi:hypothetical protein